MKPSKLFALCLAAALLLSLASCAGGDTPASPAPSPIQTADALAGQFRTDGKFVPLTAVDNANCLIRVTNVDVEKGYAVTAELTNRTKKPVLFGLRHAAVNGVQTDPFFSVEVGAGEKAEKSITFDTDALAYYDITEFTDIELNFLAVDAGDLSIDLDNDVPVHLYPHGKDKAKRYVRNEKGDRVIFENDAIKVSLVSYFQDRKTGFAANVHLVNKTAMTLHCTVDDAALNGRPCDPNFFVTLAPVKQLFTTLYWSPSFMAEAGVDGLFLAKGETDEPEEEIKEISFLLRSYDASGRVNIDLVHEDIVFPLAEEEPSPSPEPSPVPSSVPSPVPSSALV